jgi:hypothetical protein
MSATATQAPRPGAVREILIGCNGRGVMHTEEAASIEAQFAMVRESEAFDYFDRLPQPDEIDEYLRCSDRYRLPLHTASWFYALGRDEALLHRNMEICGRIGAKFHNIMLFTQHADGHVLTDDEIVETYLRVWEQGEKIGVQPTYELHVNMWTEHFLRVEPIVRKVRRHGIPFNFTMDYSHVNFKIGNPEEQAISLVKDEVARGEVVLDPFEAGSLCRKWLDLEITVWAQLRSVAPNGPKNVWAVDEQGPGRGIQYPFFRPKPGEFHSEWHAYLLEPSKEAIRMLLRHHLQSSKSPLQFITTEMINLKDYGMNAKYSLFEHNAAIARWIRAQWNQLRAMHAAGVPLAV